jgi:O-antigen ligase|tara:strand:+ start:2273 stop:3658 length:1386 start_codon:yes stop_codon:yes gene_type:complete
MSSNLSSKLFLYSLLYIALTIPFQWKYLPFSVGITMLGLVWFFGSNLSQKIKKFVKSPYAILLSGLYIIYLISILYSENKEYAYTDLLLKLPLLLFPLFLSTTDSLNNSQYKSVLRTFAISTFFAAITTLLIGYCNYTQTGLTKYFFYHDLTIFMHSAYYALYALFAIVIFIYLYRKTQNKKSKILYTLMAFGLSIFLFLLASRMQILIFIILLTVYILVVALKKKRIILGIVILCLSYAFIFLLVAKIPRTTARIEQTRKHLKNINYSKTNSDSRVQIWEAAANVINTNYLFGAGVGDVKDELVAQYTLLSSTDSDKEKGIEDKIIEIQNNKKWFLHIKEKAKENNILVEDQLFVDAIFVLGDTKSRYKHFINRGYNYHGQFLQTLSAVGLLGFFFLFFSLLLPAYNLGLKNKNYLLLVFMFMVFVSFITESMLERQAGVILYAFFISFLVFIRPNDIPS